MRTTHAITYTAQLMHGELEGLETDCSLDATVEADGETITITAVHIDMYRSKNATHWPYLEATAVDIAASADPWWREMAERITTAALNDPDVCADLLNDHRAALKENADCDRYHQRRDEELAR